MIFSHGGLLFSMNKAVYSLPSFASHDDMLLCYIICKTSLRGRRFLFAPKKLHICKRYILLIYSRDHRQARARDRVSVRIYCS